MNYISHLNNFFAYAKHDTQLTSSHISLYMALFNYWNFNRFQNPFPIYREDIMRLSKIGGKNTYYKCLKELHKARYITYHSPLSKYQPVKITITVLDKAKEAPQQLQLFNPKKSPSASPHIDTYTSLKKENPQGSILSPAGINIDTHTVSKLIPLIKHTNNTNNECKHTHQKKLKEEEKIQWKINAPPPAEVEAFFRQNNYPIEEAQKFYYYNQSKHWMLTKNIPIMDWHSAAQKWMLNTGKSESNGRSPLPPATENDLKTIYRLFLAGQNIFRHIAPDHYKELNLQLSNEILINARQHRINQLTGSNQNSVLKLLQAYHQEDPNHPLVKNDKPILHLIAQKLAVINYFNQQKQTAK